MCKIGFKIQNFELKEAHYRYQAANCNCNCTFELIRMYALCLYSRQSQSTVELPLIDRSCTFFFFLKQMKREFHCKGEKYKQASRTQLYISLHTTVVIHYPGQESTHRNEDSFFALVNA